MRLFVVVVLALVPIQVAALSCLPHGVNDAYHAAASAPDGYVPVLGALDFDPAQLPHIATEDRQTVPPITLIPATFAGTALTVRGIERDLRVDVVLEVGCSGPWCAMPQPGQMLGFLRRTSHSYVLETNACGGFMFGAPDAGQITQFRACLAGRDCPPSPGR